MHDPNARALVDALLTLAPVSSHMTSDAWAKVAGAIADAAVRLEVLHWRAKQRARDEARDKATR
jgi:hypothetical protein